ncbi:MAG: hypothetical protein AAGF54_09560, partial [Pseudomonadota bacterium]
MPNKSKPDLSLFHKVVQALETVGAPYVIIGAFAASYFGVTRATYDIDIIVDLEDAQIDKFASEFPTPRYYADPYQMRNAAKIKSIFNI